MSDRSIVPAWVIVALFITVFAGFGIYFFMPESIPDNSPTAIVITTVVIGAIWSIIGIVFVARSDPELLAAIVDQQMKANKAEKASVAPSFRRIALRLGISKPADNPCEVADAVDEIVNQLAQTRRELSLKDHRDRVAALSGEEAALTESIAAKTKRGQELETQNRGLDQTLVRLKGEKRDIDGELGPLRNELGTLRDEVIKLRGRRNTARDEGDQALVRRDALVKETQELEPVLRAAHAERDDAQQQRNLLVIECTDATLALNATRAKEAEILLRISELEARDAVLVTAIAAKRDQLKSTYSELAQVGADRAALMSEIDELIDYGDQLRCEADNLSGDRDILREEVVTLNGQCAGVILRLEREHQLLKRFHQRLDAVVDEHAIKSAELIRTRETFDAAVQTIAAKDAAEKRLQAVLLEIGSRQTSLENSRHGRKVPTLPPAQKGRCRNCAVLQGQIDELRLRLESPNNNSYPSEGDANSN